VTKFNRLLLGAVSVGAIGLGSIDVAQAATILVTPSAATSPSDTLTVYNGKGKVRWTLSATETTTEAGVIFLLPSFKLDRSQVGNLTYVINPPREGSGLSDIVGIYAAGNHGKQLALGFQSDGDPAGLGSPPAGALTIQETHNPVNVTRYLPLDLRQKGWTAAFTSDLEPITTVPEPAAWALMLVGFGLAAYALRRRPRPAISA